MDKLERIQKVVSSMGPEVIDSMLSTLGVTNPTKREHTHKLVENTKKWMLTEEYVATDGIASFTPVLIPMLVRTYPGLIGPDVVGTQPLTMPTGVIYGWRPYLIGKDEQEWGGNSTVKGAGMNPDNAQILVLNELPLVSGGFTNIPLNAQLNGYSVNAPINTVAGTLTVAVVSGKQLQLIHSEENNYNILVKNLSVLPAGKILQGEGIIVTWTPTVGAVVSKTYTVTAVLPNQDTLYDYIFTNYTGPQATSELEANNGLDMVNRMGIKIEKAVVEAKMRKLRVDFSFEAMQDAMSQHNFDLQTELIKTATREIAVEIDQEIIGNIRNLASMNPMSTFDFNTVSGINAVDKIQELLMRINNKAMEIARATRMGQGNFIITSSRGLSLLSSLPGFEKAANQQALGASVTKAGTLNGIYKVYLDAYSVADEIIIGFKGTSETESGLFFCPYTPIQVRTAIGQDSFNYHNLFYSRYAVADNIYGAQKFYRKIILKNVDFL